MALPLILYRSVLLGHEVYKHTRNKTKSNLKDKMTNFILRTRSVNINKVEPEAQLKLLKNIKDFADKNAKFQLKHNASFAMVGVLTAAKFIAILGVVGVVGYYLCKLLVKFLEWCEEINKKYKVLDNLSELYHEWQNSNKNIFIFIHENWNSKFNIKGKLIKLFTNIKDWCCKKIIAIASYIRGLILKVINGVIGWFDSDLLSDKKNPDPDDKFDESGMNVRSPYSLTDTYNINNPELSNNSDELRNPYDSEDSTEDDFELTKEGDPPEKQEKPPDNVGKSFFWKMKDKAKSTLKLIGFGNVIDEATGDADENAVNDVENQKNNPQTVQNTTETNKIKKETVSVAAPPPIKFNSKQMIATTNALKNLRNDVIAALNYDESILQFLHKTLENSRKMS